MKLNYFTIGEMVRSDYAEAHGIDNRCNAMQRDNLIALIQNILDPLREAYGKPIRVNSGYRCKALNDAVKGSKTSDHMRGCAADITGGSPEENRKLFDLIQDLKLPFDQLIDERGFRWIHVSHRPEGNRGQVFAISKV